MQPQGNLEFCYIDFSNTGTGQKLLGGTKTLAKDLLVPFYVFYDASKRMKNGQFQSALGEVFKIGNEATLNMYSNAQGNNWIIKRSSSESIQQYYVIHPKISKNQKLIEANDFLKYVYDEFYAELLNYIRSHCSAKSIYILREQIAKGGMTAGAKVVEAGIGAESTKSVLYHIDSDTPLKKSEPLRDYLWLDRAFMQAVDSLVPGASFKREIKQDFTFGINASIWQKLGGNIDYAQNYRFIVDIQC